MIRVGIARPQHFYGPEVFALVEHFTDDPDVRYVLVDEPADVDDPQFDLAHVMMGIEPRWRRHRTPRLHDYASLSTPPHAHVKDLAKRFGQSPPLLRSFLNPYVRDHMKFGDSRPYVFRDMGVPDYFYSPATVPEKQYDIGYAGSLTASRGLMGPLQALAGAGFRLLLVGEPEPELRQLLQRHTNVTFTGRMAQPEVADALRSCAYGLNYVADVEPYNRQTSTKVLEYSALGLGIISNDYAWVRQFQAEHDAVFALLDPRSPLTPESLAGLSLRNADAELFRWSLVLRESGLRERIQEVLREP
ncbi:MAG: glycosyltransferase [Actinomycetia bacterium]|nr:glycosyltransferase [Actinomycetes bacterium]